ncbi:MAG: protein kinase [Chlamydiota bacterium]
MVDRSFQKQVTLPDLSGKKEDFPLVHPTHIGPYKVEGLFSKGGMSILYLGTDVKTSKSIMIKVLSPKYSQNKEIVDRFLKEAEIIAMTNHPNIIKLYGQGKWEKGLYIAMEFVQGISLRQFILQKSLSQKRALEIILQVAYALCHFHTHGVIHRDLKPENILITESGDIKVIDFGIAQLHEEISKLRITQTSRMMGTPIYMSPEQKESPGKVSYASDIFSLGIIAYELVLGKLSHGIIHVSLLPKKLQPIIEKALQINPKDRYQDIVDFITDISQYIKSLSEEPQKEEKSDEIFDMIQKGEKILITPPPKWQQIDIGWARKEGISLSAFYLDFFHLPDNRYIIVIAEPLQSGLSSFFYTSLLKGMIEMHVHQAFVSSKKDLHPIAFLQALQEVVKKELFNQEFSLSFLLLHPDKDSLIFTSCAHNPLMLLLDGSQKISLLETPNLSLGNAKLSTIVETATNWNVGDRIFFSSLSLGSHQKECEKALIENALFPVEHQAKKTLLTIPISPLLKEKAVAIFCLERRF